MNNPRYLLALIHNIDRKLTLSKHQGKPLTSEQRYALINKRLELSTRLNTILNK